MAWTQRCPAGVLEERALAARRWEESITDWLIRTFVRLEFEEGYRPSVVGFHPETCAEYGLEVCEMLGKMPKTLTFAGRAVCIHPAIGPLDMWTN